MKQSMDERYVQAVNAEPHTSKKTSDFFMPSDTKELRLAWKQKLDQTTMAPLDFYDRAMGITHYGSEANLLFHQNVKPHKKRTSPTVTSLKPPNDEQTRSNSGQMLASESMDQIVRAVLALDPQPQAGFFKPDCSGLIIQGDVHGTLDLAVQSLYAAGLVTAKGELDGERILNERVDTNRPIFLQIGDLVDKGSASDETALYYDGLSKQGDHYARQHNQSNPVVLIAGNHEIKPIIKLAQYLHNEQDNQPCLTEREKALGMLFYQAVMDDRMQLIYVDPPTQQIATHAGFSKEAWLNVFEQLLKMDAIQTLHTEEKLEELSDALELMQKAFEAKKSLKKSGALEVPDFIKDNCATNKLNQWMEEANISLERVEKRVNAFFKEAIQEMMHSGKGMDDLQQHTLIWGAAFREKCALPPVERASKPHKFNHFQGHIQTNKLISGSYGSKGVKSSGMRVNGHRIYTDAGLTHKGGNQQILGVLHADGSLDQVLLDADGQECAVGVGKASKNGHTFLCHFEAKLRVLFR